jgi:uncharacterized membrane protein
MKNIAGTALRAVTGLTLLGACAALIASKDDIRRYLRMRSM